MYSINKHTNGKMSVIHAHISHESATEILKGIVADFRAKGCGVNAYGDMATIFQHGVRMAIYQIMSE